jgi:hypothetical protein
MASTIISHIAMTRLAATPPMRMARAFMKTSHC